MALPHGAVGWYAVCDCGISWSYSLAFKPVVRIDLGNEFISTRVYTSAIYERESGK